MHKAAMNFVESVKDKFPDHFQSKRVLEVGSRYINGTVRTLFQSCDYTGLDLSKGPCVDEVCHVGDYQALPFDTIISCEALEHDNDWMESLQAEFELLKSGGLLILTAAGSGRAEHGTTRTSPADSPDTNDYYCNITPDMFWKANLKEWFSDHFIQDKDGDFQFWGIKA